MAMVFNSNKTWEIGSFEIDFEIYLPIYYAFHSVNLQQKNIRYDFYITVQIEEYVKLK